MDSLPLILTRAAHCSACLLVLGAFTFDALVAAPACKESVAFASEWPRAMRRLLGWTLPLALVSGAAWFVLVAMEMSDLPLKEAVAPSVLKLVLLQTQFGHVWEIRGILWAATVLLTIAALARRKKPRHLSIAPALATSVLLSASLAWSGHGQDDGQRAHLAADIVHIVASGFWPAGLVPLMLMLWKLRKQPDVDRDLPIILVQRFSAMSLIAVALLIGSGIANGWFLLGPLPNLYLTQYGILLTIKLAVFLMMLGLGARNLLKWKPRFVIQRAVALRRIWTNVVLETIFALGVMLVVGALGLAPPPATEPPHAHHHEVAESTGNPE